MQIKEKILFKGNDIRLKIPLSSDSHLNGLQQTITDYIERETGLSINPAVDGETFRTKNSASSRLYSFKFYNGSIYTTSLLNTGITQDDIDTSSYVYRSSFFIMQVFDSVVSENQTLLHNSYFNGFDFTGSTSLYNILSTSEFSNMYIPQNFLDSFSGNTKTLYAKFYFYNAKNGKLIPFINETNQLLTTESKLYHNIIIDKVNRTYSNSPASTVFCIELVNPEYVTKVNNTLDSFNDEKPTYPVGNKFNSDGTYEEVI